MGLVNEQNLNRLRIVLAHLDKGGTFVHNDREYGISEDGDLLCKGMKLKLGEASESKECWLIVDCSLKGWLRMASELSEEELFHITASNVITEANQKDRS